jgi:hypothetical protein
MRESGKPRDYRIQVDNINHGHRCPWCCVCCRLATIRACARHRCLSAWAGFRCQPISPRSSEKLRTDRISSQQSWQGDQHRQSNGKPGPFSLNSTRLEQRRWRLADDPIAEGEPDQYLDPEVRARTRCNIFLGYTSNLISSGLREVILHLVKHKHVAALVTTAGGIEEDFIKCLGNTYLADFGLDGADLRRRGMNRIGNLVVPNQNYCKFEDWLTPLLDAMLAEQNEAGTLWTPSSFIRRLGQEINNEESVYYWAYKVISSATVFCTF